MAGAREVGSVRWSVLLGALLLVGCGSGGEVDLTAGDAAAGQQAFGAHCVACHGAEGEGTPSGPSLAGPGARQLTAEQIVTAVREGASTDDWAGPPMPALPAASDEDLADIVAYLRQLRGDSPSPSSP